MLASAITRAGTVDGEKVRDALATTRDFKGVTGPITIDIHRNAIKPGVVLKIRNGKPVYYQTVDLNEEDRGSNRTRAAIARRELATTHANLLDSHFQDATSGT